MTMTGKAFARKLFGDGYERLLRKLFVSFIIFGGLRMAAFKVQMAASVLYLMASTVTGGMMWQALSSKDNRLDMLNLLMLPVAEKEFVFSYTAFLGAYTILMKTAALFAVVFAVSQWSWIEITGAVVCAVHAVLMAAAVFSRKKYWFLGGFWAVLFSAILIIFQGSFWVLAAAAADSLFSYLLLRKTDGYAFYYALMEETDSRTVKSGRHCLVWRYFFRYLRAHKNYLINMAAMWCAACILPLFFRQTGNLFSIPVSFALLSLNTPIGILISCDPGLERGIRFLPGGGKRFLVPYCLFIFLCNMAADSIFLCSFQIQTGGVTGRMICCAVFFAFLSALCSVLLEWFYPIRGWKIESDLWQHPRKYLVPAGMLLLAAFAF